MGKKTWSDSYCVGIRKIDAQHRRLFELIDALEESLDAPSRFGKQTSALDEMVDYIQTHFFAEERMMNRHQYPAYHEHRVLHLDFVRRTLEFQRRFGDDPASLTKDVLTFLREWWVGHILGVDMEYKVYFAEQGVLDEVATEDEDAP